MNDVCVHVCPQKILNYGEVRGGAKSNFPTYTITTRIPDQWVNTIGFCPLLTFQGFFVRFHSSSIISYLTLALAHQLIRR